jgi:threonine dehydratase
MSGSQYMAALNQASARSLHRQIVVAEARIRAHVRETPVEPALALKEMTGCEAWLKLENQQRSGSFKIRGAANTLLSMSDEERQGGVITASSGNHGTAVAFLLNEWKLPGEIYVPETISRTKLARLRELDARLVMYGADCVEAEIEARRAAEQEGKAFISPYNDPRIIAGQGTVAVELIHQIDDFDVVLVPVGGGGLISGIAGSLKASRPKVEIIGCQPEASAVMYESVRAGQILDLESTPTISDGTAGGLEPGSVTFKFCQDLVDDWIVVDDNEIRDAMRILLETQQQLVEGSAALSVAALVKCKDRFAGRRVVLVLSGARISIESLREVICEQSS